MCYNAECSNTRSGAVKRFVFLVFISLCQVQAIKAWISWANSKNHFYSQWLWIKRIGRCVLLYRVDTHWLPGTPPANSFCGDFITILFIQSRHTTLRLLSTLLTSNMWISPSVFTLWWCTWPVPGCAFRTISAFIFFSKLVHDGCSLWNLLWVRGSVTKTKSLVSRFLGLNSSI